MKIERVEYRRLVTHGDYENTAIGAVASVDPDQSPIAALELVQEWVETQIGARVRLSEHVGDRRRELYRLDGELSEKRAQVERAREKWDEVKALLEQHGVQIEDRGVFADMPF